MGSKQSSSTSSLTLGNDINVLAPAAGKRGRNMSEDLSSRVSYTQPSLKANSSARSEKSLKNSSKLRRPLSQAHISLCNEKFESEPIIFEAVETAFDIKSH